MTLSTFTRIATTHTVPNNAHWKPLMNWHEVQWYRRQKLWERIHNEQINLQVVRYLQTKAASPRILPQISTMIYNWFFCLLWSLASANFVSGHVVEDSEILFLPPTRASIIKGLTNWIYAPIYSWSASFFFPGREELVCPSPAIYFRLIHKPRLGSRSSSWVRAIIYQELSRSSQPYPRLDNYELPPRYCCTSCSKVSGGIRCHPSSHSTRGFSPQGCHNCHSSMASPFEITSIPASASHHPQNTFQLHTQSVLLTEHQFNIDKPYLEGFRVLILGYQDS